MRKILLRGWNWLASFWRRAPVVYKARAVGITTRPSAEEDKPSMVRCFFCHRRTRLGHPCCNWRYLAIVAASLHIGGRLHPHRGFTQRVSGAPRASGQHRYRTCQANRHRMRERSIKINRGLL